MWKKVVGPTIVVSLLWLAINFASTLYIQWVSASHELLLRENVASIHAAGDMKAALWQMLAVALHRDEDSKPTGHAEWNAVEVEFQRALRAAERAASLPEERALLSSIQERFSLFQQQVGRGFSQSDDLQSAAVPSGQALRLADEVAVACNELLSLNDQFIQASSAAQSQLMQTVRMIRIGFIIVGPTVGLLLGFAVSRNLHRSISKIHVTLQDASSELPREVGQIEVSDALDLPELHNMVQELVARFRTVMQELQQARRDAVRSERLAAVGELAAGVAHELRNPLTSIKLLIQMAVQRSSSEMLGPRPLQVVIDEIARMETTIQGLLDFARPPALCRVRHDLRETLKRAMNLIVGRSQQQNVSVTAEIPEHPEWLDVDPNQLQQVFVNLLLNGIEAMPQGGVLSVTIDDLDSDSRISRVRFADTGCGITETVLSRMFEPFVTTKERGTGLGLAVSRSIVEGHGGMLLAANRETGGAIFTVELPRENRPARAKPDLTSGTGTGTV